MVVLYSKEGCAPCMTLKYWLDKKGIDYKEKNILNSEYRLAPTIVIGENVITGLNFGLLSSLLKT